MAQTLQTDRIMEPEEAQKVFDFNDEDEAVYLLNGLSSKARAWLNRIQLIEAAGITENVRPRICSPTLFLHAPVNTADFGVDDITVKHYAGPTLVSTWSAAADELVVTSDDFGSRVDLVGGPFPAVEGADFLRVEYKGGWAVVPGDVFQGAIMQGRVDLKRMRGEVGLVNRSKGGESSEFDQRGVLRTVGNLWQLYRILG